MMRAISTTSPPAPQPTSRAVHAHRNASCSIRACLAALSSGRVLAASRNRIRPPGSADASTASNSAGPVVGSSETMCRLPPIYVYKSVGYGGARVLLPDGFLMAVRVAGVSATSRGSGLASRSWLGRYAKASPASGSAQVRQPPRSAVPNEPGPPSGCSGQREQRVERRVLWIHRRWRHLRVRRHDVLARPRVKASCFGRACRRDQAIGSAHRVHVDADESEEHAVHAATPVSRQGDELPPQPGGLHTVSAASRTKCEPDAEVRNDQGSAERHRMPAS
jgi:hypothetical protein